MFVWPRYLSFIYILVTINTEAYLSDTYVTLNEMIPFICSMLILFKEQSECEIVPNNNNNNNNKNETTNNNHNKNYNKPFYEFDKLICFVK